MTMPRRQLLGALGLLGLGLALGWGAAVWRGAAWPLASPGSVAPMAGPASAGAASAGMAAADTPADAAIAPGAAASAKRQVLYWYDPMVPTQRFDKPGKSPFMDMQLVPRYAEAGEGAATATLAASSGTVSAPNTAPNTAPAASTGPTLAVSAQARQALGLRLATVERQPVGAAVEAAATVQLNEREISIVQARTAGFVERVYARAPGDVVVAGAPLVDLLNPDWLGAQQEYLAIKATGETGLARAARQRLQLLGMAPALLDRIDQSGQPVALQTVTAPAGGVITELAVRAGMTVAPGMTLARINGLGTVWLEAALPEALAGVLAASIAPGQTVQARFPALPGQVLTGRVTAILPEANRDTRTLRLRIELPNPGQRLRAGLFAQVSLQGTRRDALVVPAEGVIRTGRRALVYVAEPGGRFRPVEVEIGEQFDDRIVIRSGLVAGQQIVASGQFLIDSEASLQGVLARAAPAAATPSSPGATR